MNKQSTSDKANELIHEYQQAMEWFANAVPSLGNAQGPRRKPDWKPRTLAAIESDMRALGYKWDYPKRSPVRIESPTITYCFDAKGGFFAKSVTEEGVMIEYAYPSSEYATKARKNPVQVAECMVGMQNHLAYYKSRAWYAERVERMDFLMQEAETRA